MYNLFAGTDTLYVNQVTIFVYLIKEFWVLNPKSINDVVMLQSSKSSVYHDDK